MNRVALVRPPMPSDGFHGSLTDELSALGVPVVEISPRGGALDALLRPRKLGDHLGRVPGTLLALRRSGCSVAHTFLPADGVAAAAWAAREDARAVLTICSVPRREALAGRRLRLATLLRAIEGSAAVVATSPEVRDGLDRWLNVSSTVIPCEPAASAAAAYARLYERVGRP